MFIFTVCQQSCWKVMFSVMPDICLSTWGSPCDQYPSCIGPQHVYRNRHSGCALPLTRNLLRLVHLKSPPTFPFFLLIFFFRELWFFRWDRFTQCYIMYLTKGTWRTKKAASDSSDFLSRHKNDLSTLLFVRLSQNCGWASPSFESTTCTVRQIAHRNFQS